ncbi:DUF5928 domain-containing protein [Tropicimonas sp. TH_r6]|uniref:DUF5928 domain-containing protein n=1 Tax=Tropicimonas sp. TH_r6 TaxID=3082085 RepID=UPI002953B3C5|nr:DUF5928 domain-containing protein [Tropicimonas sp. TH_r6]MDV7144204.1 DUF5928 domain-containing protein [Tropicimonas sp. TH_r6]
MVQIAYILLCHKDPDAIIAQARRLTAVGDCLSIHFDASAPAAAFEKIRAALADNGNVTFAARRLKCGWGEWSLVAATLEAVKSAVSAFPAATHFYMLSGDCMPIKSAEYAHAFLAAEDVDYIESFDYFESGWIKTGFVEERLIYRHFFNERERSRLFYTSFELQKRLGLKRAIPEDLKMMIGSQWWCLRRSTVEAVLEFCRERRDVIRFFSTTWIPDETFFQTAVRHLVAREEIRPRTLTFLMFSDYGMPVNFYNDQHDLLLSQDALFARKISPEAKELKTRLGQLYSATGETFQISNEGRNLFRYLTGQGRKGLRFAPRFWESGGLGRDKELLLIVCKKWHVAKRLVEAIRRHTEIPAVGYLFNERDAGLPDLGGIESDVEKRARHRRVLVSMLFGYHQSNKMAICLDSSMIEMMQDFDGDRATVRMLEIQCDIDDFFLAGHASRIGLAGEGRSHDSMSELLATLRRDFAKESDKIRDAGFEHLHVLRQEATERENTLSLSAFLSIPEETARQIALTDHLFDD